MTAMTEAAEEFVLAHEFGHILTGDFSKPDGKIDHFIEFRADMTGAEIIFANKNLLCFGNRFPNQFLVLIAPIQDFAPQLTAHVE